MNMKKPVNKEAFKMLAMEIGLNAAARRLGVPINTAKSWARRGRWKLPKRPGGRPQCTIVATSMHPVADALGATHEEIADATKTAILQTIRKAAQLAASKPALDVSTVAELRDLASALDRLCGGKPQVSITNQVGIVCDEATRMRLIKQREELLASVAPAAMTIPEPQAQLQTNIGAPNGILAANDPKPDSRPGSPWSMPAGAEAPSDASPVLRAWLEHEGPEPET
jgi:hypothetical protein